MVVWWVAFVICIVSAAILAYVNEDSFDDFENLLIILIVYLSSFGVSLVVSVVNYMIEAEGKGLFSTTFLYGSAICATVIFVGMIGTRMESSLQSAILGGLFGLFVGFTILCFMGTFGNYAFDGSFARVFIALPILGVIGGLIGSITVRILDDNKMKKKQAAERRAIQQQKTEQERIKKQLRKEQEQRDYEQRKTNMKNRIDDISNSDNKVLNNLYMVLTENPDGVKIEDTVRELMTYKNKIYQIMIDELQQRNFADAEIGLKILHAIDPQNREYQTALEGLANNRKKLKETAIAQGLSAQSAYFLENI